MQPRKRGISNCLLYLGRAIGSLARLPRSPLLHQTGDRAALLGRRLTAVLIIVDEDFVAAGPLPVTEENASPDQGSFTDSDRNKNQCRGNSLSTFRWMLSDRSGKTQISATYPRLSKEDHKFLDDLFQEQNLENQRATAQSDSKPVPRAQLIVNTSEVKRAQLVVNNRVVERAELVRRRNQ
jgi:hypothetical protein